MASSSELRRFGAPTIVVVTAPGCSACRRMQPDLDSVAAEYSERVALVTIDATRAREFATAMGVRATPTIIGVRAGIERFRHTGRRTHAELGALFGGIVDDTAVHAVGRHERLLRLGAGVSLGVIGVAAGPSWPLIGIGIVVGAFGVAGWRRRP